MHYAFALLTWWSVPGCHNQLPLSVWVQSQPYCIALTLCKVFGLLLAWATVKDPPPAGTLVLCHKSTPLPTDLRGSPTGCIPPVRYKLPCFPWIRRGSMSLDVVSVLHVLLNTKVSLSLYTVTPNLAPVRSNQHLCSPACSMTICYWTPD